MLRLEVAAPSEGLQRWCEDAYIRLSSGRDWYRVWHDVRAASRAENPGAPSDKTLLRLRVCAGLAHNGVAMASPGDSYDLLCWVDGRYPVERVTRMTLALVVPVHKLGGDVKLLIGP